MGMNAEETVALIAGGHTFGKCHGAAPDTNIGPEPESAPIEQMGLGWKNSYGTGKGGDTIASGIEGAWTKHPTQWDNGFFDMLFRYEWELVKSPAGAYQWHPINPNKEDFTPHSADPAKYVTTVMTTADMALLKDPAYNKISKRFHKNFDEFADTFSKAWFKLLHRDMGPKTRYIGPEVPKTNFIWQDPIPAGNTQFDIAKAKYKILNSGLTIRELVETAWASASTYRCSDMRGGANGSRIRLAPQKDWDANKPKQLTRVLEIYKKIATDVEASIADIIVLAGNLGIEKASSSPVEFTPGRGDATLEETDIKSFGVLEPIADGFRNFQKTGVSVNPEEMLLDKAQLLGLTAPEMAVLVAGLRSLGISHNAHGIFTNNIEKLSNDFFINIVDMSVAWKQIDDNSYQGTDIASGKTVFTASRVDLIFGSNSQLRAISEVYACDGAETVFIKDFISAWNKVMNSDRFDIK